jgi:hypothetical protein
VDLHIEFEGKIPDDEEKVAETIRYIADSVENGFTEGYQHPSGVLHWNLLPDVHMHEDIKDLPKWVQTKIKKQEREIEFLKKNIRKIYVNIDNINAVFAKLHNG